MTPDPRTRDLGEIRTRHLLDLVVELDEPLHVGRGPFGHRTTFVATGGTFAGDRLRGEVLPGGGDWGLFRADGALTLDVRMSLRTHDGALIHVSYSGRWIVPADVQPEILDADARAGVDPSRYYFRSLPVLETGAEKYAWLNDIVCVGSGYPIDGGVGYAIHEVL